MITFIRSGAVVIGFSVVLMGCVTPSQKLEVQKQQVQATDRIPKAIMGSTRAVIAGDASKLDSYETANDRGAARSFAEIDAIQKQVAAQEMLLKEFLTTAASAVGTSVPGGGLVQAAVNRVLSNIQSATGGVTAAISADITPKFTTANSELQNFKTEMEKKEMKLNERLKDESRALKDSFVQLNEAQKEQFKKEFLSEAAQRGVSKEELAKLDKKSPEELLSLFGGGGILGGIALTALLRTFGKSRSQKEIDELYDNVGELKSKTAKL